MNLFNKITRFGVNQELSEEIQEKVILANKVNLVLLIMECVLIPMSIKAEIIFHISLAVIGVLICLLLLNKAGLIHFSRFMTSIVMVASIGIIYGLVVPPGAPPSAIIIAFDMAICTLPFVLFHFSEKKAMIAATAVNFLQIISLPYLSEFLFQEQFAQAEKSSEGDTIYLLAVCYSLLISSLYLLLNSQRKTDKSRIAALASFEQNKEEMEATQQKFQKTLEEVEKSHAEDEKRSWAATGQACFSELLRNSHNLHEIYDELISGIVKYLGANQAALFELHEESNHKCLKMTACYAYDRKKHMEKTVEIGQGLVGQTYLEGETLRLSEIPSGYINITSGLGEAPPSFLVVLPLKINEDIAGILEMASFKEIEPYQIAFLEKLGESLASAIVNHRVSAQTADLLEQTRAQSEEMRAQEEEMRQNMEELQATQEEMFRKEKEYLQKIAALEKQLQENTTV